MEKRWSDFIFAIVVRLICGIVIGAAIGMVIEWKLLLKRAARNDLPSVKFVILGSAICGAVLGVATIPRWQTPWAERIAEPKDTAAPSSADRYKRVAPEYFNRAVHSTPKQLHDFITWLRQATVAECELTRSDIAGTRASYIRFYRRGLKAGLLIGELEEILPTVVANVGYSDTEKESVGAMLGTIEPSEIGIVRDENGLRFDGDA